MRDRCHRYIWAVTKKCHTTALHQWWRIEATICKLASTNFGEQHFVITVYVAIYSILKKMYFRVSMFWRTKLETIAALCSTRATAIDLNKHTFNTWPFMRFFLLSIDQSQTRNFVAVTCPDAAVQVVYLFRACVL